MTLRRLLAVAVAIVCLAATALALGLASAPQAEAQSEHSITFRIKSSYRYKIQVAFYSQNRSAVWPGNGQAYEIDNYRVHEYALRCRPGEKICYGGWVEGDARRYWGAGFRGQHRCSNCCYTCSGDYTQVIDLE